VVFAISANSMAGLNEIQFPVYLIGKEKPQEHDGVLFFHRSDREGNDTILIVDDKNWHDETLAQRRLKIMMLREDALFKITQSIFFISDLIKLSSPSTWFIDNLGKLFIYKKSKSVELIFKKIESTIRINTGGAIIIAEGIETRFKCLYAPNNEKFVGLLKIGRGYILYGIYDEKPNDTRRMI
jgi:hypothetical protein